MILVGPIKICQELCGCLLTFDLTTFKLKAEIVNGKAVKPHGPELWNVTDRGGAHKQLSGNRVLKIILQ